MPGSTTSGRAGRGAGRRRPGRIVLCAARRRHRSRASGRDRPEGFRRQAAARARARRITSGTGSERCISSSTRAATIDDGEVARDLGQETADIVVLSAADSDLARFRCRARDVAGDGFPCGAVDQSAGAAAIRLSVDLYVERTLRDAQDRRAADARRRKLLALWRREPARDALRRGALFACLPGELSWDAALAARGTLERRRYPRAVALLHRRRRRQRRLALRFAAHLIGRGDRRRRRGRCRRPASGAASPRPAAARRRS